MKKKLALLVTLATITRLSMLTCETSSVLQHKTIASIIQENSAIPIQPKDNPINKTRKDWNFIVYFAANNNLHKFAIQNIQQMMQVGSTNTMNAIIQIDELGAKEISRYYIQKGNVCPEFHDSNNTACVTGTQESLYNFIAWTLKNYPANHNCLVLWNHGSGIKDPSIWGKFMLGNRNDLFELNPETGLYEMNRKINHQEESLENHFALPLQERGIAFNDTFETYLTNQDLQIVLDRISKELLNGQKIDIVCMDACLMEMVEVGAQIKNSTKYMVGSEEVSRGEGYPYEKILAPFAKGTLSSEGFAKHITQSYASFYEPIDADFTQSAINLDFISALEENFAQITKNLSLLMGSSSGAACTSILKEIRRSSAKTIEFYDPDYIDLGQFYTSLLQAFLNARGLGKNQALVDTLKDTLAQGLAILRRAVIANAAGKNLTQASGLSFYFPARTIHKSYPKTVFDQSTRWSAFLAQYLKTRINQTEPHDAGNLNAL